MTDQSESQN